MIQTVAIIGAGIAGLTAGCALRKYKIKVDIFERSDSVTEFGAGITLSKNATSLLRDLDLFDELETSSYTPKGSFIRHYKTAKQIAHVDFDKDFLTADRRDLVHILSKRFLDMGGSLQLSRTIEKVEAKSGKLIFSDGENCYADLVLSCDGIKSRIREDIFDSTEPRFTNNIAWRGVIERSNLPEFPGNDQVNIYHGPGGHVVHYPMGHKDMVNFVAIETRENWEEESWKREGNKEDLLKPFKGWNENLQNIFSSSEKVYKWGLFDRKVPKLLSKGKVFLLGDAAHPMVPFLGQGGCMAIEDAFTLAVLVDKFKDDLDKIKVSYQQLRRTRGNLIRQRSKFQGKFNHLSNPLLMRLRNLAVKLFVKPNMENIHSYDAIKEISKVA